MRCDPLPEERRERAHKAGAHDDDKVRELLQVFMRIVEIARRLPPGAERVAALEQIRDFQTRLDAILLKRVEPSLG